MPEETEEGASSQTGISEEIPEKGTPYFLVGAAVVGLFLVAIVAMLFITRGDVVETPAPPQLSTAATEGKALFIQNTCGNCHPSEGRAGGFGPRLSTTNFSDDSIRKAIRKGRGAMPAYSKLPDDQLENLVIYIRAIKPAG